MMVRIYQKSHQKQYECKKFCVFLLNSVYWKYIILSKLMKRLLLLLFLFSISFDAFANTTIYDDGSSLETTTYDDGSTLNVTTDTDGNITTSSTPNTEITNTSIDNILWIDDQDLRTWNVDMDTIPRAIVNIINILLWVAGTIAVFALIYYAVQMQINSGITWDSSWVDSAKKWMRWAILGFALAILAWFIIIRFIEILSGLS